MSGPTEADAGGAAAGAPGRVRPVIALAVAAVLLGLAIAAAMAAVSAHGRRPPVDAAALAARLEGRAQEAAAGLHARVTTLAELPRLAAAVSTDADTVRDLTEDELAFRPRRDETVAIAQIPVGGRPIVLLVLPAGAAPPPFDRPGPRLRVADGRLVVTDMVKVVPRERAHELSGAAAGSWRVGLGDLAAELGAAGIAAWIEGPDGQLPLGLSAAERPEHTRRLERPLAERLASGLRLVVLAPPEPRTGPLWVLASLLLVAALAMTGRSLRRLRPPPLPAATPVSSPAFAAYAAAPALRAPTGSGRRIGRYELLRRLGSGGIAEVYLARAHGEAGFHKLVALKVLQHAVADQPRVVEDFLDEARLASRLDHPNVVQIHELGRADGEYFIAMELVEGADLARLIEINHQQRTPVPLAVALSIVRKLSSGLHAAHTATGPAGEPLGLVHRDVKCANVFVSRNGGVKIGDFGIAKASHSVRLRRTDIGHTKGTPGYMAPEQRMGQAVDARADVYGVGAIAYELVSGVPINLDLVALVERGKEGWPHLAPLASFRPDVPAELERAILRALSFERHDRFDDCAVLEAALDDIAHRHGLEANEKTIARWVQAMLAAEKAHAQQARAGWRP